MSKVLIILPAYNAEKTITKTYEKIPDKYKKNLLLVDDYSSDNTIKIAKKLNIPYILHTKNKGYGANQKTCYLQAIQKKVDIVVMLHPDYQYAPEMIVPLISMLETGKYDCVLGSRILAGEAIKGKMPLYKYISNRILTFIENVLVGAKLSEYHTGLRAYKVSILKKIPFEKNSDSYIFDNQILLQILTHNYRIGEISTPCRYFKEASSINCVKSIIYGLQCLQWSFIFLLGKVSIWKHPLLYKYVKKDF